MMPYRYILRYFIDSEYSPEERIEELALFCEGAQVEEVMLLTTPEELSAGHPTGDELTRAIALAIRIRERLARSGVELSLNPWTTLYQVPRGRRLRPGQTFRVMVGENGAQSPLVACPLCPEWQDYLSTSFARMAAEIEPVAIWIEDDWRLHNHGGDLGWGGCFCDEHLKRFSRQVGETVTRELLLERLLQGGAPHPWREEWLSLSRETLLEPLRRVSRAIRDACATTRVGLMSSQPDQHSIEGRDWQQIREAIACEPLLLRPHMLPYTQERALRITPAITRQTLAAAGDGIEIYPELENSPRCGVYSKTVRSSVWQMWEAALIGSHGITINHFDMLGTGTALDLSFEQGLKEAKPILNALRSLKLDDSRSQGVQVLFSPQIASALHLPQETRRADAPPSGQRLAMGFENPSQLLNAGGASASEGATLQRLFHPSFVWSDVCSILGISHRLTSEIDPSKGPVMVSGQTLRAYSREAIATLLGGVVVLDAEAVMTLLDLGFGSEIGVRSADWQTLGESAFSYEEIEASDAETYGIARPRMSAQRCSGRLLKMEPAGESRVHSLIYDATRRPLWPGLLSYRNAQGGEVLCLTYPVHSEAQFFMGFFNPYRRKFLHRLLLERSAAPLLTVSEEGARAYQVAHSGGVLVAVLNPLDDALPQLTLNWPQARSPKGKWLALAPDGCWHAIEPAKQESRPDGDRLVFTLPVEPLKGGFLWNTTTA